MHALWAVEIARDQPFDRIVELCCGAGQIGLLAAWWTRRPLLQVDTDPVACRFARLNAGEAGLADQVEVMNAPAAWCLPPAVRTHLIIADPPSLTSDESTRWAHSPISAVDGGADGLDRIRDCLELAVDHLHPDGSLLLQVQGAAQAAAVDVEIARVALPLEVSEVREVGVAGAVMRVVPAVSARGRRESDVE